jgi:hypothetical protein
VGRAGEAGTGTPPLTRLQPRPSPLTPQRAQKPVADGERKRKKGAAKRETAAAGERDGRGEGKDGKKRKLQAGGRGDEAGAPRRAADGERRGGGGSTDKRERPGAQGSAPQAEKSRKAKPAEPLPVSGKNLGRRRRANVRSPAHACACCGASDSPPRIWPDIAPVSPPRRPSAS